MFWKEIGIRMNIKDIPDTLDELITWSLVRVSSVVRSTC